MIYEKSLFFKYEKRLLVLEVLIVSNTNYFLEV